MFQDAKTMFGIDMAFGATPAVLNLKTTSAGPGRPLRVSVNAEDLVGATGFTLSTGATAGLGTTLATYTFTNAELLDGTVVEVPDNVQQYIGIALTGAPSAGTWTAGMVLEEGQTNL